MRQTVYYSAKDLLDAVPTANHWFTFGTLKNVKCTSNQITATLTDDSKAVIDVVARGQINSTKLNSAKMINGFVIMICPVRTTASKHTQFKPYLELGGQTSVLYSLADFESYLQKNKFTTSSTLLDNIHIFCIDSGVLPLVYEPTPYPLHSSPPAEQQSKQDHEHYTDNMKSISELNSDDLDIVSFQIPSDTSENGKDEMIIDKLNSMSEKVDKLVTENERLQHEIKTMKQQNTSILKLLRTLAERHILTPPTQPLQRSSNNVNLPPNNNQHYYEY